MMALPVVPLLHTEQSAHLKPQHVSKDSMNESFQDALKILVAMVKNQSPDQPMDAKEFGDQIMKFMSIEQTMKTNQNLDRLIQVQQTSQAISALPLVGHQALIEGQVFEHGDHPVSIQYDLPHPPKAGLMMILDHQTNKVVRHLQDAPLALGLNEVDFDGKDDLGEILPKGLYRAVFMGRDLQDQPLSPKMLIRSHVTGIRQEAGQPVILFGHAAHPLHKVIEVKHKTSIESK